MKKRILSLTLVLGMLATLITALPMSASAETTGKCGENLTWTLDDYGKLTISGTGPMFDYYDDGSNVPWYSSRFNITSVEIKNGLTRIGNNAFQGCRSLTSVPIPDSVISIGIAAFYKCSNLTSVIIPNSVKSIDDAAFLGCNSLASVTLPNGLTSISNSAFHSCNSLSSITIPSGVVSINGDAFYNCPLLSNVYYVGTKEQWSKISIGIGNEYLTKAKINYSSTPSTPNIPIETPQTEITVTVDGTALTFDQSPIILNGRTLVPLRAIAEALNFNVEWDGETKTVIITTK